MAELFETSVFFGVAISLLGYEIGLFLKRKFKKALFHPLLIAILFVMAFLGIFHVDYQIYNEGAKYISYLLTPATVCLAIPLYRQLELLKKHKKAIFFGITAGVLSSLLGVLASNMSHCCRSLLQPPLGWEYPRRQEGWLR